jgi:DNA polymerase-1
MPHIQQLKKTSRDIFSAKENYTLLYADYSQFEPGILANLAEDEKLIECYNQEDLYTSLSVELFGNKDLRPFCKIIFLSFMYGMSSTGLENLVKDFFHEKGIDKKEELQNFFGEFTNLIPYKTQQQEIAFREKRICSSLGNYRNFDTDRTSKHLPNKVKRWVLSQKVQGTASLILKTAIMNCCRDTEIEFLIPMHDAALFQVPTEMIDQKKVIIKDEFEKAMLLYCPKLKPKVIFKKFTE